MTNNPKAFGIHHTVGIIARGSVETVAIRLREKMLDSKHGFLIQICEVPDEFVEQYERQRLNQHFAWCELGYAEAILSLFNSKSTSEIYQTKVKMSIERAPDEMLGGRITSVDEMGGNVNAMNIDTDTSELHMDGDGGHGKLQKWMYAMQYMIIILSCY